MYPTVATIRHRLECKDHRFFRELGFETMAKMICDQGDEIERLRAELAEAKRQYEQFCDVNFDISGAAASMNEE